MIFLLAFYPLQNGKLFLSRNPDGISFLGFSILVIGIEGYAIVGFHRELWIVLFGNTINTVFTLVLLFMVLRYANRHNKVEQVVGITIILVGSFILGYFHFFESSQTTIFVAGWVGVLGVIFFYPIQNFSLLVTKDPSGLSLPAYISVAFGLALYVALGFMVGNTAIIIGNGVSCIGSLFIIYLIFRGKRTQGEK